MLRRVTITVDGEVWDAVKPVVQDLGLTRSRYIGIVLRAVLKSRNLASTVQRQAFMELLGLGEDTVPETDSNGGLTTGTQLRYRDKVYTYDADAGLDTDDGRLSPATVDKMVKQGVIEEVRS